MIRRIVVLIAALLALGCLHFTQAQTASKARIEAFAKLPDWSGLWEFDAYVDESVGQELGPEGLRRARAYAIAMQPTFAPEWQVKVDEARKAEAAALAADPNYPVAFGSPCAESPFPATMLPGFYEWRVTPEETTFISSQNDSIRHIYTDGRGHPAADELWPTTMGDSIGHWEGDTLVIDTIAMRNPNIFMAAEQASFSISPLSDKAHAIERVRMVNRDEMEIQLTVEDSVALAKPIHITITHLRVKDFNRMEDTRDADCNTATDRNPVVNGRFTVMVKPAPAAPIQAPK
jgi:hypothetical protein